MAEHSQGAEAAHARSSDSYAFPSIIEGAPRFRAPPIRAEFTPNLDAPARARAVVDSALHDLQFDADLIERSILAASELATNAVMHAHTRFRLLVQPLDTSVWIAVEDQAPLTDRESVVGQQPHGLGIIAALADHWGVNLSDDGKVVWAELPQRARKT